MLRWAESTMAMIWAIVADEMTDAEWRSYFCNYCDLKD